jgi:hypothetical protein
MRLYADQDYGGATQTVYGSVPDLRAAAYTFNDVASSIVITRRTVWAVYSDINYSGQCETVTENIPWLGATAVGNDNVSSVRSNYTCAGPVANSYVTDITAVAGGSRNVTCPAGYAKKWQELNQGVGGDFVYACVQYGTDSNKALQEVYVALDAGAQKSGSMPASNYLCNGSDQPVTVDLNSGANNALDVTHEALWFCKHKQGTNGGSGATSGPDGLYNQYFSTGTKMRDLLFYLSVDMPGCTVQCDNTGTSATVYLEYAQTAVPLCQTQYDTGWWPAFHGYQASSSEKSMRVPQSAGLEDLNVGLHLPEHTSAVYIYACVREGNAVTAADTNVPVIDTTPPIITPVAMFVPSVCVIFCNPLPVPQGGKVTTRGTVTLTWTCTDDQDRSPTVTPKPTTYFENRSYTQTGTCTDAAGNKSSATFSFTLTAP